MHGQLQMRACTLIFIIYIYNVITIMTTTIASMLADLLVHHRVQDVQLNQVADMFFLLFILSSIIPNMSIATSWQWLFNLL